MKVPVLALEATKKLTRGDWLITAVIPPKKSPAPTADKLVSTAFVAEILCFIPKKVPVAIPAEAAVRNKKLGLSNSNT